MPSRDMNSYYRNLGLHGFIKIYCKKKKSSSLWDAVLCGIIGIVQVVGGALLTYFSAGLLAQVGYALIMEGISDIAYAIEHGIKGDFKWSSWATKKAVSLAVTALTLGLGGFSSVATASSAFVLVGKAIVNEIVARGIDWLVGSLLQEVLKKIIELLGNALRGLMNSTLQKALTVAGTSFQNCIDAALLFKEGHQSIYPQYMENIGNAMKNVVGQQTVISTVGNVASAVSGVLKNLKSSNSTLTTVISIVSTVTSTINMGIERVEIIRVIDGQGFALKRSLDRLTDDKVVSFLQNIRNTPDTAEQQLRIILKSPEDLIKIFHDASILDLNGQLTSNYAELIDNIKVDTRSKDDLKQALKAYQETIATKKAVFDQSNRDVITRQILDGWCATVSTYLLDCLTKKLQGVAMDELRSVANKFTNQYLQSSQNIKQVISMHNFHQQCISRLLNGHNLLAIGDILSSIGNFHHGLPIVGTAKDIAEITNFVIHIQQGDFSRAMQIFVSTPASHNIISAVSASVLGQDANTII